MVILIVKFNFVVKFFRYGVCSDEGEGRKGRNEAG